MVPTGGSSTCSSATRLDGSIGPSGKYVSADTTQSRAIQFSDWLIEPHLNRISRDGEEKQLEPKTMDVLAYLVEHAGDVVSQDALLQRFWPGRVVEESTVHRRINQIRRVLGDEARHPVYIETISRRGYRAIAPVTVLPVKEEKEAESRSELQSRTPPFPAYEGDEPYVFVCYAHRDRQTVYPELVRLRDAEVNVWYDEGISPGSEWTDELAKAIEGCDQFLYFVSPAAVQSENCRSEVRFALNHAKPLVTVWLCVANPVAQCDVSEDGLKRSSHEDAAPLLISHGWPGSITEFVHIIEPLTEPERFDGRPEDAFHVIAPSIPG